MISEKIYAISLSKQEALLYILEAFETRNVNYCILGNYNKSFFEENGDIDIVVSNEAVNKILKIMYDVLLGTNIKIVQAIQHEQTSWYIVVSWFDHKGNLNSLKLDFCGDYYRHNIKLIEYQKFLNNRIKHSVDKDKQIYVPDHSINFIYYLIKRIGKQNIEINHQFFLKTLYLADTNLAEKLLEQYFDVEIKHEIICCIENDNWNVIKEKYEEIYSKIIKRKYKFSIYNKYRGIRRNLKRIFYPTGISISFLGPDGCGKSTLISHIQKDLEPIFRKVSYTHFRPKVLGKSSDKEGKAVNNPHALKPRSNLISYLKMVYFVFDYILGGIIKDKPSVVSSTLVIYDRYFHDILVDPKRYRFGGEIRVIETLSKIIPEPNLIFVLYAPANILQNRKREVSYNESKRQVNEYMKLAKDIEANIIDTNKGIQTTVGEVELSIINYLEDRIINRYKLKEEVK
ncbi:hypothetical protein COK19_04050 [Bacillus cereus]|uniref:hypothetical protein n=1 Tax=Bacillus cereus TaxID=1396 RepID=UPI000BF87331|nr:hypothetical protein [Bacillus cereus]PFR30841.1 hypothetical protein COK19_04050 [Bacillus cereus]